MFTVNHTTTDTPTYKHTAVYKSYGYNKSVPHKPGGGCSHTLMTHTHPMYTR